MHPHARKTALAVAVALALAAPQQPVQAAYDYSLNSVLTLDIKQKGDQYDDEGTSATAKENLNTAYLSAFKQAADYYWSVSGDYVKASRPVRIEVVSIPENSDNASAGSDFLENGDKTLFTAALFDNRFGNGGIDFGADLASVQVEHGQFAAAGLDWFYDTMTAIPSTGKQSDLTSTLIHELAHAFGIGINTEKNAEGNFVMSATGLLAQGAYDCLGRRLTGDAVIISLSDYNSLSDTSGNYFVVNGTEDSVSGAYFTGTNTAEVLNGAKIAWPDADIEVEGIPLNGFEGSEGDAESGDPVFEPEFSHLELKNGLMSHQEYRNYNTLMEAELAVLQDVGVTMDRRNLFGYSVYNSGSVLELRKFVNTNPYYARSGGQWLTNEYNSTAYGTGLHVYGSYNDITQAANILSDGIYGIGIRVDGEGNVITVGSGTIVAANGTGGKGLLVAYGKDHTVNVAGTVVAAGSGGNALEFNFGDNNLGNHHGYRGSYIDKASADENTVTAATTEEELEDAASLRRELSGALVENLNISGNVIGGENAVYISKNAYVKNINLLSGASLIGNIVSDWDYSSKLIHSSYRFDENSSNNYPLLTSINFGVTAGTDGTLTADPNFTLSYDGNISGANSLVVNFKGGTTAIGMNASSAVTTMAVTVDEGATLITAGTYDLSAASDLSSSISAASAFSDVAFGTLVNNGTLSVGGSDIGSLIVKGKYEQGSTGNLVLQYTSDSNDVLKLDSSAANSIGGTISFALAQDYYEDDFSTTIDLEDFIDGSYTGDASLTQEHLALNSPTLTKSVEETSAGVYSVSVTRNESAYLTYASEDANSRALAQDLTSVVSNASLLLQDAIAAMDFTAADGSGIRSAIDSLNPAAYANLVNGVLSHHAFLNDVNLDRTGRALKLKPGTYAYADPYMTHGRRGSGLYATDRERNYGVVAGADRVTAGGSYGAYLNLNYRSQKAHNSAVTDRSLWAGLKGALNLNEDGSLRLLGDGRIGADFVKTDRRVTIGNYSSSTAADFTAFGASLLGGVAYELRLTEFTVNFGADLSYSHLRTPDIRESGDLGLTIGSDNFNSLKAGVGAGLALPEIAWENGGVLSLGSSLRYHREILDDAGGYEAGFRYQEGSSFRQRVDFQGKDIIYAAVGGEYAYGTLSFGADLGGAFYLGEGRELFGRAKLTWRF